MKLSQVLAAVNGEGGQKTAAATTTAPAAPSATAATGGPSDAALKTALHQVLEGTKTAAATPAGGSTPTKDLEKIAGELADAETQALIKQGQIFGAASADGLMARLAQYNDAAEKLAAQQGAAPTKTASVEDSFEKFASANPELVKQAAEVGYFQAKNQIGQLKQAAYDRGYEKGVLDVYKIASDVFVRGFEDCGKVVEAARKAA